MSEKKQSTFIRISGNSSVVIEDCYTSADVFCEHDGTGKFVVDGKEINLKDSPSPPPVV